jgi:hypothetical protein
MVIEELDERFAGDAREDDTVVETHGDELEV